MNQSKTHRKPVVLYCSQPTQTQPEDDSKSEVASEDSDFPPCLEGNLQPLISSSSYSPHWQAVATISRYPRAAASVSGHGSQRQLTENDAQLQRHGKPNTGLRETNIINTVDSGGVTPLYSKVVLFILTCITSNANSES
jgi:hypothetical protein